MLTVATYNLYLGADLTMLFDAATATDLTARAAAVRRQLEATRFEERAAVIAALLERERVDLVGLQEVSQWTDGEAVVADFLPTLLEALARSGCRYDAYAATPSFAGGLPVGGEWMHVQGCNVTLVRSGGPVEVVAERVGAFTRRHEVGTGVDGIRFPIERGWSVLECRIGGRELRFANTHTEAYDAAVRDAQRDELLALLDSGGPRVLVGDFNATPDQVGMPAGLVDAWAAAGEGAGPTWGQAAGLANPDNALRERIDYVFVGDARVHGCRVVGDRQEERTEPRGLWPSDHAAVVAELDLTR